VDGAHELVAGPEDAGLRLDAWLARRLPELSRSRLQALIAAGEVRLDGSSARASLRVKPGQRALVRVPAAAAAEPLAQDIPLRVVHEDEALVVVDKPAGLVVHPGAGAPDGTLVNALLARVKDLSGIGGVMRPGIVHRLDRGTSGLLVVAKDDATHRALARQFAARTVEKEYLALVLGSPARAAGEIDAPIGRDPVRRQRMSVKAKRSRAARSSWRVVERFDGACLVRVAIHTGRTHQIRVHLSAAGLPIVGDPVYGRPRYPRVRDGALEARLRSFPRQALHAERIAFHHPVTQQLIEVVAPVPQDLRELLRAIEEASR
jgi:23S rRNA pseudouridine1911/1915/1917 synthase